MKKQYPERLFHKTPSWVEDGAVFHIRIRCASENMVNLTESEVAAALLNSATFYADKGRWFIHLFLLMSDHIHALLLFPKEEVMSRVIGDRKRYQRKEHGVRWQDDFFDHRIRNTAEYFEKVEYIRRNPVVKGLCEKPENWTWVVESNPRGGTRSPSGF